MSQELATPSGVHTYRAVQLSCSRGSGSDGLSGVGLEGSSPLGRRSSSLTGHVSYVCTHTHARAHAWRLYIHNNASQSPSPPALGTAVQGRLGGPSQLSPLFRKLYETQWLLLQFKLAHPPLGAMCHTARVQVRSRSTRMCTTVHLHTRTCAPPTPRHLPWLLASFRAARDSSRLPAVTISFSTPAAAHGATVPRPLVIEA